MKGQKQSVIDEVMFHLPNFIQWEQNAIVILTNTQLESIKANIVTGISVGDIEYSKDRNNLGEVRPYARSMVMNHLKKAKELNGGASTTVGPKTKAVQEAKLKLAPKGIDANLLPESLKELAKSLV